MSCSWPGSAVRAEAPPARCKPLCDEVVIGAPKARRIVTASGRRGRSGGRLETPRDARGDIDLYGRQVKAG